MIDALRENKTLQEMIIGILLSGAVIIGLLFALSDNAVNYTIGLAAGMIGAIVMATHMAYTIEDAVLLNEKDAAAYIRKMTYVRYGIACIIVVVIGVSGVGSAVTAVFGLLLLKMGAYLQPLVHRIFNRKEENMNFTEEENQVIMDKMQIVSPLDDNTEENLGANETNIEITQGGE